MAVAHDCLFLPSQCLADLKTSLVKDRGTQQADSGTMCAMSAFDTITSSCQAALGTVKADVLGYNDPGNQTAYYASTNRAYMVATVFGYSSTVSEGAEPAVELAWLRPTWAALPQPVPSTTSATRSTTTAESTSVTSSSSTVQSSKTTTTTAEVTATMHCTGGTRADGISDNLLGLCSFSCDYDHCPENVCVCTPSALVAVAAPTGSGNGCPDTNELSTQSAYAYNQDLCASTCSHTYCPSGACRTC
ncbi:hypothetical protein BJ170DRAFT_734259 [Xylariales sp. AK1849]|nr:hypothetical protein BJ170DRAFT_734259 [Xylariales sp. AK1849]